MKRESIAEKTLAKQIETFLNAIALDKTHTNLQGFRKSIIKSIKSLETECTTVEQIIYSPQKEIEASKKAKP